jgi:hypothetical protein
VLIVCRITDPPKTNGRENFNGTQPCRLPRTSGPTDRSNSEGGRWTTSLSRHPQQRP